MVKVVIIFISTLVLLGCRTAPPKVVVKEELPQPVVGEWRLRSKLLEIHNYLECLQKEPWRRFDYERVRLELLRGSEIKDAIVDAPIATDGVPQPLEQGFKSAQ